MNTRFLAIVPVQKTLTPSVEQPKRIQKLCLFPNEQATEKVQSSQITIELQEQQPVQSNIVDKYSPTVTFVEGFVGISFLSSLSLGIFLYKKYRAYRATVLLQQIEFLERLWKISTQ